MGYTHYFAYDPNAESFVAAWPQMVTDALLIATHVQRSLGVRLAGGFGDGEPELSERRIWLNGTRSGDLHHETLLIDPAPPKTRHEREPQGGSDLARQDLERRTDRAFVTGFCKTARKPYDIAVTSILLRCRHLAPDAFVIASDGAWELEWQHGGGAPRVAQPARSRARQRRRGPFRADRVEGSQLARCKRLRRLSLARSGCLAGSERTPRRRRWSRLSGLPQRRCQPSCLARRMLAQALQLATEGCLDLA
jgi:hypothetical protein